jgi:hypothetical protein
LRFSTFGPGPACSGTSGSTSRERVEEGPSLRLLEHLFASGALA